MEDNFTTLQNLPIARTRDEVNQRHESNRKSWNEAAIRYTEEVENTIHFIRTGQSNLHPIERANLGDLSGWCNKAIHLQCASGRDTLSLWVEGVKQVVGVDISDAHIANAIRLTEALNAPASWFRCDILDTPHELDGTADLVYTGRGAITWLHDLEAWANVVHRLLKPGGVFHILDDHPASWLFDPSAESLVPSNINYFAHSEVSKGWGSNYIGDLGNPLEKMASKYERLWPISTIFHALTNTGLIIEKLGEHPESYWDYFPNIKPGFQGLIPLTFSIKARKPLG